MNWILNIRCSAGKKRPDCDTKLDTMLSLALVHRSRIIRTPHSEKHNMVRPSGAHSARTRPSAPESILAVQSSSLSLNTCTTPFFAFAANRYSESQDHAACVIEMSEVVVWAFGLAGVKRACVGDGDASKSQERVIWKVSACLTTSLSWNAVRMKCAPGLKDTREFDCG